MHGPRCVNTDEERHSLAQKTQRRTVHLHAVLASGAADFEAAPGRDEYDDDEKGQNKGKYVQFLSLRKGSKGRGLGLSDR